MRRVLFALLAACAVCLCVGSSVAPDMAVMDAPQVDDVTLLQLASQSHQTASHSTVAHLESELAAALASQQQLEAELAAEQQATVGAEAQVDSEQLAEIEATQTQSSDSKTDVEGAAELEAEMEAEAEAEMEADADADAEVDVDAEAEAEADQESSADADQEAETEVDAEAETEVDTDAESDAEAEVEADEESEDAAPLRPRFTQKKKQKKDKDSKKEEKHELSPKAEREAREAKRRAKRQARIAKWRGGLKVERSDNNAPPDVATLANGKKLYKSWVVNPNLVLTPPAAKKQPRHSKERVLTRFENEHYSHRAAIKETPAEKQSEIRRAFLRLNPALRKAALRKERKAKLRQLRRRYYSPESALIRAFRGGNFPQLKFDPPTSTTQVVTQQLTIQKHQPSVRQRAEVSALRAATRTLRRINSKRREFKKALKALGEARASIQKQIHQHHVARALQAKKVAARAQRRAAWSALLQHRRLRKELLSTIARALRKGHLTGSARRQAIAALIKRNITPKQRAKLHAYIRGQTTRAKRHQARRERHAKRRAAKAAKKQSDADAQVGLAQKNGASKQSSKATSVRAVQKNGDSKQSSKAAAVRSAAPVSDKDQKAIDALIARIKAAINHPDTPRGPETPVVGAASVAARVAPAQNKASASVVSPKGAAIRVGAAAPQQKNGAASQSGKASAVRGATPPRFQQLSAAAKLAAEAEAEALSQLNTETEVDDIKDQPLLQVEAQVEAASKGTEEFLHEYHL